jgi:hypothetical protein
MKPRAMSFSGCVAAKAAVERRSAVLAITIVRMKSPAVLIRRRR